MSVIDDLFESLTMKIAATGTKPEIHWMPAPLHGELMRRYTSQAHAHVISPSHMSKFETEIQGMTARFRAEVAAKVQARVDEIVAQSQLAAATTQDNGLALAFNPDAPPLGLALKSDTDAKPKAKRTKHTEPDALRKEILSLLTAQPALRMEVIAKELGQPSKTVSKVMRKMVADGEVTSTGVKRATQYSVA